MPLSSSECQELSGQLFHCENLPEEAVADPSWAVGSSNKTVLIMCSVKYVWCNE